MFLRISFVMDLFMSRLLPVHLYLQKSFHRKRVTSDTALDQRYGRITSNHRLIAYRSRMPEPGSL